MNGSIVKTPAQAGTQTSRPLRAILASMVGKPDFEPPIHLRKKSLLYQDYSNEFVGVIAVACNIRDAEAFGDVESKAKAIATLRRIFLEFRDFREYVRSNLTHFGSAPEQLDAAVEEVMADPRSVKAVELTDAVRALYRAEGKIDLETFLALYEKYLPLAYGEEYDAKGVIARHLPNAQKVMELMAAETG